MDSKQLKYTLLLALTALIWGIAFVAQSEGMKAVGPFTFNASRMLVGAVALAPVIRGMDAARARSGQRIPVDKRALLLGGVCCGAALFVASSFQQSGMQYTTVGKSGFLTAMYIVLVPVLGVFLGRRTRWALWLSVALAVTGMYFLCISGETGVNRGDVLCLLCALFFACHIMVIDRFSPRMDGVRLSCVQFLVCALLSAVAMAIFEKPTWAGLRAACLPILYAGVMSSGVGYTLQIISQKHVNPTLASLVMSLESVFSALAGWALLGQSLSGRELFGCALMFTAIILAQLPLGRKKAA